MPASTRRAGDHGAVGPGPGFPPPARETAMFLPSVTFTAAAGRRYCSLLIVVITFSEPAVRLNTPTCLSISYFVSDNVFVLVASFQAAHDQYVLFIPIILGLGKERKLDYFSIISGIVGSVTRSVD